MSQHNPKHNLPKYMNLQASTQFELAQSIDAMLQQAESAVALNTEQSCLVIWLQQLIDHLQDEFLVPLADDMPISDRHQFEECVKGLVAQCSQFEEQYPEHNQNDPDGNRFSQRLRACLKVSFQHTLDLMHAQNLWRFDVQRDLQQVQERLLNELAP
ncbi:hypothetical protein [Bermanella sp. R86510]|uniref:hypothetical protein n=1 Tax=unclassified Bermanella TaxID=2627862 RepID=UPI0037C6893E